MNETLSLHFGFPPLLEVPGLRVADLSPLILMVAFAILVVMERRFGRSTQPRHSYLANLQLFLINEVLLALLSASAIIGLAGRLSRRGLLEPLSMTGRLVVSFVLLDLSLYFWHRASHRFNWLWRFHRIHHSDPWMNASTAFRLHVVEVILITLVKTGLLLATGIEPTVLLVNETVVTLFVMVHHANLSLPAERWWSRLFIVPHLHRLHHGVRREEHDHNFGFVFSFWDRLFGTLAEKVPGCIGLTGDVPSNGIGLLAMGFQSLPSTAVPVPQPAQVKEKMIAEAAFFRAEKRGFTPGFEVEDWLIAEREILGLSCVSGRGVRPPQSCY